MLQELLVVVNWEGCSQKDHGFTEHVENCAAKVADFHCLRFKKIN